jgi:hypothetical protein
MGQRYNPQMRQSVLNDYKYLHLRECGTRGLDGAHWCHSNRRYNYSGVLLVLLFKNQQ